MEKLTREQLVENAKKVGSKVIELYVEVRKNRTNGNEFNAYHTYNNKGYKVFVKFRKDAGKTPNENGLLIVHKDALNYNDKKRWPELWIHEFEKFVKFDELARTTEKSSDDDLPF